MERITIKQAAIEWQVHPEVVRWMCETGRLPPGYRVEIKGKRRHTFYLWKDKGKT